jgi:DNA-binding NarL/FixJ family response regulator
LPTFALVPLVVDAVVLAAGGIAAGETPARPRERHVLTPQQTHIAELVAGGATNREVAARLFLSPRTVDHHLRNIFTRLGIRSRVDLARLMG